MSCWPQYRRLTRTKPSDPAERNRRSRPRPTPIDPGAETTLAPAGASARRSVVSAPGSMGGQTRTRASPPLRDRWGSDADASVASAPGSMGGGQTRTRASPPLWDRWGSDADASVPSAPGSMGHTWLRSCQPSALWPAGHLRVSTPNSSDGYASNLLVWDHKKRYGKSV